ncbi:MAG: hypothetical protein EOP88_06840 [Verrucomicrobiaceae bacterium]|nr:MAG: hypothetical protein EOP88_06840 [Verrucomicrobiaceae bacterium]
MKTIPLSVLVVACGLLANCSSPVAMTNRELAGVLKESPLGAKRVEVSVKVTPPGEKAVSFPSKKIRLGQSFSQESTREFVYPAGYSFPGIAGKGVEPATPKDFETIDTGITMNLKADSNGSMVIISGKVEVSKFDRFIRMGGELGHPISDGKGKTLTENRVEMPAIRTYMTPVYVAAKPGKPVSFEIDHPEKGTTMTVTVKALD